MNNSKPVDEHPSAPEGRVIGDRRIGRGAFLLLLAVAISAFFFQMIQSFVLTLLLAAIFAALAHPGYRKILKGLKGREAAAAALTMLLTTLVVLLPLLGIMVAVGHQAVEVGATVGPWIEEQRENPAGWRTSLESIPGLSRLGPYQDQILAKVGQLGKSAAGFAAKSLATGMVGSAKFFLLLFIMPFGLFYFLRHGRGILDGAIRYIPLPPADTKRMLSTFVSVTRATLKGALVIGLVQGGLAGAAFALAGVPGSLFWAVIIAVLSLVPGIGPPIVYVPVLLYLALGGHYGVAVGVGVWCFGVVITIDNFLRPWLVGKDTGMPDLLILLGTLGGLAFFGVVGIVIGPIVAALFLTVWELYGSAVDEVRASSGADQAVQRADHD